MYFCRNGKDLATTAAGCFFYPKTYGFIFYSVTRQLTAPIEFFPTMEVNGGRQLFGDQHSFKYLLLWLQLTQVWNNLSK